MRFINYSQTSLKSKEKDETKNFHQTNENKRFIQNKTFQLE
jgi:hypothetical protein